MVEFTATIIGLVILVFVIQKILIKILSVEKKKLSETSGKRIDRWGQRVFLVITLVMLWFMMGSSDLQNITYFTIYLVLLSGYQAIMEFIFIKKSRQYISTTILLIILLVIMFNFDKYPFLK